RRSADLAEIAEALDETVDFDCPGIHFVHCRPSKNLTAETYAESPSQMTNDKWTNNQGQMKDVEIRSPRAIYHFSLVIGHCHGKQNFTCTLDPSAPLPLCPSALPHTPR